jgi:exosome complex RNA-binding protein Rrp4
MKSLFLSAALALAMTTAAFAHGGNDHVRGVVTQVSAQSITVQVSPKVTKTLTLSDKTVYKRAGKTAQVSDLKVGDRVVVDVPEKTTQAVEVTIGAAPAAKAVAKK